jgi:hypothetical protein
VERQKLRCRPSFDFDEPSYDDYVTFPSTWVVARITGRTD